MTRRSTTSPITLNLYCTSSIMSRASRALECVGKSSKNGCPLCYLRAMYNHQRDWAEDDDQTIKEHVEKILPGTIPFSLDDAFSETDDIDPNIEFSSVSIRADLARAASYSQDQELAGVEESGVGPTGDGDTAEHPAGPSSSVCGILVARREPHHSTGILIFRAPHQRTSNCMQNSIPFRFRVLSKRNLLMQRI